MTSFSIYFFFFDRAKLTDTLSEVVIQLTVIVVGFFELEKEDLFEQLNYN